MQEQSTRTYHRLSLQVWENADGVEGWRVRDRQTGKVVLKGNGDTIEVIRGFLSNERVEALLCAEIDRAFPELKEVNDRQ